MAIKVFLGQAENPSGWVGKIFGYIMDYHNKTDNEWTVDQLNILPRDYILEVGFGTGLGILSTGSYIKNDGFIAGIDHSELMVQEASKRNAKGIEAGIVSLALGDVCKLPYKENFFNKAFSINCIYFWQKPLDGLKEIYRVLKPGGLIAITVRKHQLDVHQIYTSTLLMDMLTQVGFYEVQCKNGPNPRHPIFCVLGNKPSG
jgi:ubiquinone/menaquinone biosynthesis C-methylase UbiE